MRFIVRISYALGCGFLPTLSRLRPDSSLVHHSADAEAPSISPTSTSAPIFPLLPKWLVCAEMRCQQKRAKPSDVFPVNDLDFHYQLPPGLKAGTLVKLIEFSHGYWTVETADGQRFEKIFTGRIESGWLYELNGRWLEADDPVVVAAKKRERP